MDIHFMKKIRQRHEEIEEFAFTETGKPDYNYYIMPKNEKILYSFLGMAAFFLLGFAFYKSVIVSAILSLLGLFMPEYMYARLVNRRKERLNLQFKDLLYCISSGLSAGRSIETTLKEAEKELYLLYPSDEFDIIKEIRYINHGLNLNIPVEELFKDKALLKKEYLRTNYRLCSTDRPTIVIMLPWLLLNHTDHKTMKSKAS